MAEKKSNPSKPINGERPFDDTDERLHKRIIAFVKDMKDTYFGSNEYKKYKTRVEKVRFMVNQEWQKEAKTTRFGLMFGIMRAGYDNYVDGLNDLFDVDDYVFCQPDSPSKKQFASDWQHYINRMLRSIHYKQHLAQRFLYIPDYGWSVAHDQYVFNEGLKVKPKVRSAIPGFDGLELGPEMDALMDRPKPCILKPHEWFGSPSHSFEQPYQGHIEKWYLKDIVEREGMATADGKPIYNLKALSKLKERIKKGEQKDDGSREVSDASEEARDVQYEKNLKLHYVDVTYWYGALNMVKGMEDDPNEYYVECTDNLILRWQENPRDRYTRYTHMRSHPYPETPFSRSFLDGTRPHQKFMDFFANTGMEVVIDNATRHWAVWENSLLDPNDFYFPKGLNAFLRMEGDRVPQMVGDQRSGAFSDIKDLMGLLEQDRQRVGATDQEMGVNSKQGDDTATQARILASASSKKMRAMVKRIADQAIVPQIKNLTMLSLVYGKPEKLQYYSPDGEPMQLTPDHVNAWLTDTQVRINDTITRDRDAEAMKTTSFMQLAMQIVPNFSDPSSAVKVLRYAGDIAGISKAIIDDIAPEPAPIPVGGPMMPPGAMPPGGMPPEMPPQPMPQGAIDAASPSPLIQA